MDTGSQVKVDIGISGLGSLTSRLCGGHQSVARVVQLHGEGSDQRVVRELHDDRGGGFGGEADRLRETRHGAPALEERINAACDVVGGGIQDKRGGERGASDARGAGDLALDGLGGGDVDLEGVGVADACDGGTAAVADAELVGRGLEVVQVEAAAVNGGGHCLYGTLGCYLRSNKTSEIKKSIKHKRVGYSQPCFAN